MTSTITTIEGPIDPECPLCDGDGYTERFNDDHSGVITELCDCPDPEADVEEWGPWL